MKRDTGAHGFLIGGKPESLFQGAASYYAEFRRPYPPAVVECLVTNCHLNGSGRLLDVGSGTGQVFRAFAHWFGEVIAIDPDPEMVRYAQQSVRDRELKNVTIVQGKAEKLVAIPTPVRMTIFGASFHWTDRGQVAEHIYELTEPGGHFVLLCPNEIPRGNTEWESVIRQVITHHLGADRRAGSGIYREGERHEVVLGRTRFGVPEIIDIPVREEWTVNEIIGFLYSTSFASKSVLADCAPAFESELRSELLCLNPEGVF